MPQKKTRKIVKSKPKIIEPTKIELKRAYNLVTNDLFNKLIKAKDKDKVVIGTVGSLGTFHKTERKVKSGIIPRGKGGQVKKSKGLNTYVFYSLRFKPSAKLKEQLNKSLMKKYR